jgi:hypothetical protein
MNCVLRRMVLRDLSSDLFFLPQLDHLLCDLGEGYIVADKEELVVPVIGHLFPADVDGPERMGLLCTLCLWVLDPLHLFI